MKNLPSRMKRLLCAFQRHPVLSAISALQALFLLALIVHALVTPQRIISVNPEQFESFEENTDSNDLLAFTENENFGADNPEKISSTEFYIPSGAYRADIAYDSFIESNSIRDSNGTVTFSSSRNIQFDELSLDDEHRTVSGKLWVPILSHCDDLSVSFSYNGRGSLTVESIILTELMSWRVMRVIGFALAFWAMDLFLAVCFSTCRYTIKAETLSLGLIIFASSLPFFNDSLFIGHDLRVHLRRIVSIAEELGNGQFPVKMVTGMNNGYGYPISIFYCDLFLYPSAVLYRLSVPLRTCYQIYAIAVNTATTIFTWLSLEKMAKTASIRLLGTALYVLCMYRFVNLFTRAAVGEYTAMAFLPLVIAGTYAIFTSEKPVFRDWMYLTVGMTGLILSHILTTGLVVGNLGIVCILLFKRTLRKETMLAFF